MAKYELKTKKNDASVEDFIIAIESETVRNDCRKLIELMQKATNAEPKMWGPSIIGFGSYQYKNSTGDGYEWMQIGFSPRKQNLTLYLNFGEGWNTDLLAKLGKHKIGKGCLYIKRLSEVDLNVLDELIEQSAKSAVDKP